jgi:hypothetical protein
MGTAKSLRNCNVVLFIFDFAHLGLLLLADHMTSTHVGVLSPILCLIPRGIFVAQMYIFVAFRCMVLQGSDRDELHLATLLELAAPPIVTLVTLRTASASFPFRWLRRL